MDRREVTQSIGSGILGTTAGAMAVEAAVPTMPAASTRKQWGRRQFTGAESFILPTHTPDLATLDEAGVRNDVRHSIRQGFHTLCAMPLGLNPQESRRLLEIVADEANGKAMVTTNIIGPTLADKIADLHHAEAHGVTAIYLPFERSSVSQSEDEIYEIMRAQISATSMGTILYAAPKDAFRRFHPNGLPMKALDRLADLPNVFAIKMTQTLDGVTAYQVAECVGDRLIIGAVNFEFAPMLANKYDVRWSAAWAVDSIQSPEKPYGVDFMRAIDANNLSQAADIYWTLQPALEAFFNLQAPTIAAGGGGHPWQHIKYYKWLTGGNGGLLRDLKMRPDQVPVLDAPARAACRAALASVGIACTDLPEEAFVVGTAAYERGARLRDMADLPQYAT
jgi:4-hydroxy-tetrahydrodipicolinate synthase